MEKYIELGKIIGPQGPAGVDGQDGKSAYQSAVEAGYSGTETAFNAALSKVPGHIADGDIHVTAEEKEAWADSDVFIAIYGTTTLAEIYEAYQAGKAVNAVFGNTIYALDYITSIQAFFTRVGNNVKDYIKCLSTGWSSGQDNMVPSKHASTHASGGSDPITPESIGAPTVEEMNTAISEAIGNAIGGSY